MTWWVKVADELLAVRHTTLGPPKKPEVPGAATVKIIRKQFKKAGRSSKKSKSKLRLKSPAKRWAGAQSKARSSKAGKAVTVRKVTPLRQRTDNPADGYEVMHAQLGDMTPGERSAARFARTYNRIDDAYWQRRGEWSVQWTMPSGIHHQERFDTSDEAYWFCHGQNGALPRQVLASDYARFTVGIYYRGDDEYTDPWSEDALDNLARKNAEQGMEAEREDIYGRQLGRDLRSHYGQAGNAPQGALSGLWALARQR